VRDENGIPHDQAESRFRRASAQQNRGRFEIVSWKEMCSDNLVQDAA
jgi:hypothetical protein